MRINKPVQLALGLLAMLLPVADVAADVSPPANELSQFETHFGASLGRDCGFSRRLPSNQSLWLFCDTPISGAMPFAVTADSYPGKGLAIIEETTLGGGFRVWRAPANTFVGSWTLGPTGSSLAGCNAGAGLNLCRALTGHPEISTSTTLLMSYFDPAANHVTVVGVPW
jgi:hypothetical protein